MGVGSKSCVAGLTLFLSTARLPLITLVFSSTLRSKVLDLLAEGGWLFALVVVVEVWPRVQLRQLDRSLGYKLWRRGGAKSGSDWFLRSADRGMECVSRHILVGTNPFTVSAP